MNQNPQTVIVSWPDGEKTVENVETWWYDGNELNVRLLTGEIESFDRGNVVAPN